MSRPPCRQRGCHAHDSLRGRCRCRPCRSQLLLGSSIRCDLHEFLYQRCTQRHRTRSRKDRRNCPVEGRAGRRGRCPTLDLLGLTRSRLRRLLFQLQTDFSSVRPRLRQKVGQPFQGTHLYKCALRFRPGFRQRFGWMQSLLHY